jgi:3',5'-cyclic-AMP phosphodiesterase
MPGLDRAPRPVACAVKFGALPAWRARASVISVRRLILSALLFSCLRVASPRAERDRTVGLAEAEGVSVEVRDGLAVVRSVASDAVSIWANAPALHITLRVTSPRALTVRVDNVLASVATSGRTKEIRVAAADFVDNKLELDVGAGAGAESFRFLMYADVQEAIDRVQDVYAKMNAVGGEFVICAGDQTSQGTRAELERFERELRTLHMPVYMTLGNHELGQVTVAYHDFFGRGSSSFVFRDTRFTLLDSASATLDPEVYEWLDGWLLAGRDQLHIVSMHVPPLDPIGTRSGSFASRNEANKLLAKLATGRVDLTLYGHVHSYYAFSNAEIPAYIAGGGGAIPERMDGIGRHFLQIDVDPKTQTQTTTLVRVDE